jgi:oxygen-independent coproporphyrinogen-3 oxidase
MKADLITKYDGRVPRYTSYPTAPHFNDGVRTDRYRGWLAELTRSADLSLYIHVPFCDTLCWFCGCHTTVVNKPGPVASYLDVLLDEIDLVTDVWNAPRGVGHIHLGGGSPTILSTSQVSRLFGRLRARFQLIPDVEIAVEVDPRGLGDDVVAAYADAGLTRASIGVQDLDPRVQRAVNRVQPFEDTRSAVDRLRAHGVRGLNIDLMYGLPHQTVEGTRETVSRILELRPDRIALFGYAHVPWMKRHQKLIPESALPGADERLAQFEAAAAELVGAGYIRIGLDHFAAPEDSMAVALRERRLRRNFQGYTTDSSPALLGLGASAIGRLPQGYVQNHTSVRDYAAAIREGRLATARGAALDDEDRLRADLIERLMCEMTVDLGEVADEHGFDLACLYPVLDRLREMQADGVLRIDGCRVTVHDNARPLLRAVAAAFDSYLTGGEVRHAKAI